MTKQQLGRLFLCLTLCFAPVAFAMYVHEAVNILQPAII